MTSLPVIIIGVNPFAIEVAHIFQLNNVIIYGFLDDDIKKQGTEIGEIPVLGTTEDNTYWELARRVVYLLQLKILQKERR